MSTQAYDAVIATIVVASDATSVTKAMVKSTTWREGTSGEWKSTSCTLEAGKTYQFRTPNSGSGSGTTAVLPNIEASVTVGWDTSGNTITTVGDYFLYYYAAGCEWLTSLSVPDTSGLTSAGDCFMAYYAYSCMSLSSLSAPNTSGLTSVGDGFLKYYAFDCWYLNSLSVPNTSNLTSVGDDFMRGYAYVCMSLTSLSVPDISGLTTVGSGFMAYYASYCSDLTSLLVPDTSGLETVGSGFMASYANGCTNLTTLSIPDTSGLTTVADNFMDSYAYDCTSLTSLILKGNTGWFSGHNVSWNVPSSRLNYLYAYCESAYWSNWKELTASGKTLYINYVQATDHVLVTPSSVTPVVGQKYALPPFRRS